MIAPKDRPNPIIITAVFIMFLGMGIVTVIACSQKVCYSHDPKYIREYVPNNKAYKWHTGELLTLDGKIFIYGKKDTIR